MGSTSMVKILSVIFFKVFVICSLFGLVYVVYALNNKLEIYNMHNSKVDENILINYNESINKFVPSKSDNNIQNFISCYEQPIKNLPSEINDKISELNNLFDDKDYTLSFSYEDLYTGFHVSYNEDELYFSASAIKAPVVLYLFKLVDEGLISLDKSYVYLSNYYAGGSGSIQYEPIGSIYSLRELSKRAIVESDNIAYQMIAYNLDRNDIKNYWYNSGADNFWTDSIWGKISSKDGAIYMKELYKYYLTNTDNSNELMEYFYNSVMPLIKSTKNNVVHKSGWNGSTMHDTALIFDEYPYVLSIMTNKGEADYETFFTTASNLIEQLHDIYWKKKSEYCYNQAF